MRLSSEPLGLLTRDAQEKETFLDVFKPAFNATENECEKDGYLWVSGLCFRVSLYRTVAVRKIETNVSCNGGKLYLVVAELGEQNRDIWEPEEPEVVMDE